MAQRTIHYLFGELLSRRVRLRDKERFLLGSLLPDAYADRDDRDITHFISQAEAPDQVYFDFNRFGREFGDLIRRDELYLGYYMHLAEDCFYRKFSRDRGVRMPTSMEEILLLHRDYHILNCHIVEAYGLHNQLTGAIDLASEPISDLAPFRVAGFLEELAEDFREDTRGQTHFITAKLVDEFVKECLPLAEYELRQAMAGKSGLRARDFASARIL